MQNKNPNALIYCQQVFQYVHHICIDSQMKPVAHTHFDRLEQDLGEIYLIEYRNHMLELKRPHSYINNNMGHK